MKISCCLFAALLLAGVAVSPARGERLDHVDAAWTIGDSRGLCDLVFGASDGPLLWFNAGVALGMYGPGTGRPLTGLRRYWPRLWVHAGRGGLSVSGYGTRTGVLMRMHSARWHRPASESWRTPHRRWHLPSRARTTDVSWRRETHGQRWTSR